MQEVNAIVSDSYSQLKKVAEEKGFSLDAASRSWEILQSSLSKITDLAGDAADQILDNHPKLKEQVGKVMVERIAAASDTVGGDTTGLADLAQLLGADWLPVTSLTEDGA